MKGKEPWDIHENSVAAINLKEHISERERVNFDYPMERYNFYQSWQL